MPRTSPLKYTNKQGGTSTLRHLLRRSQGNKVDIVIPNTLAQNHKHTRYSGERHQSLQNQSIRSVKICLVGNSGIAGSTIRIGGFVDAKFLRLFLQSVGNTAGCGVDAEAAFAEVGRIVEGMGEYPWKELRGQRLEDIVGTGVGMILLPVLEPCG